MKFILSRHYSEIFCEEEKLKFLIKLKLFFKCIALAMDEEKADKLTKKTIFKHTNYFRIMSNHWSAFLIAFALAILSFLFRLDSLQQTLYANGWDGYFYLVQLKAYVEEGALHAPDASLIYPLLLVVNYFAEDYVLTYKIMAALLAGCFTFGVYFVANKWSESFYIALLLASITVFSPHLTYFTAQYPKNLLGLNFLLLFLFVLPTKKWLWILLIVVLNYFGHRLSFSLSVIMFGLYVLFLSFARLKERWKSFSKIKWKLFLKTPKKPTLYLVFIAFLLVSFFAVKNVFPGLLNIADLERMQGLISPIPHFAPYSFASQFGVKGSISILWMMEIIWTAALFIFIIPFLFRANNRALIFSFFLLCSLLVFPFFQWSFSGIAYRFYLVFVLICPLFLCFFAKTNETIANRIFITIISVGLLFAGIFSMSSYNAEVHDPPYTSYEKLTNKTLQYLDKESVELVIAAQPIAAYFSFITGIDAMHWLPEYEITSEKLWRIAYGIRDSQIRYYLTEAEYAETHRLGVKNYLIREDYWQKILQGLEKDKEELILDKLNNWQNPNEQRPAYLLNRKASKE